ncbi:hypothetical protein [Pedosphaera parvula]|uniref:Glycosyl hydrolase family 32 domain protein n=1 Tax=Pedosphaera parvula (strain Ellin514) TaxID=320771 RepID=B9XM70_PEDPL|nr:hypothetical protein [Pedosphaera parvula]EEF59063.1 conserved hypothetical protein [Pedosphaera parvula Ellin514]
MNEIFSPEGFAGGQIVREPVGFEPGYWAGAPGFFYDKVEKAFYLTYRLRRPRGVSPDRGGEARIARSTDLKHFEDIWSVTKDQYESASIERSAIYKGRNGQCHYFTSYVDPMDGRWCVAQIKSGEIANLDPKKVERVFSAAPLGLEGIKDPWIYEENGVYYMFLSVAVATPKTRKESHDTLDIFNTGECVSATGLATSTDLNSWEWQGIILKPGESGWDRYCRRINSVLKLDGKYFAFYDGSASEAENYEEKAANAVSSDLRAWRTLTPEAPFWTSPNHSKSVRYMDAQILDGVVYLFYEFARHDGAHDLRLVRAEPDNFATLLKLLAKR